MIALSISEEYLCTALVIKLLSTFPENALLTLNGPDLLVMCALPVLPQGPYSTPKFAIIIVSPKVNNHFNQGIEPFFIICSATGKEKRLL